MRFAADRKHMKRILYCIPAILLMGLIFFFSTETGTESGNLSRCISEQIAFVLNKLFKTEVSVGILNIVVRKGAHFTEYMLLAFSYALALRRCFKLRWRMVLIGMEALTFIYACTDELHQTMVSGRAGMFTDVLIDSAGGLAGVIILIIFFAKRIRQEDIFYEKNQDNMHNGSGN